MSNDGAAPRAAVAVSNARAAASRKNGARSRGPRTAEGKARAAQNAVKHGIRALKYVVLPDESAADFHAFEEAIVDDLVPVGALQSVLARRVAVAAWRLARADRMEVELFEERRWEDAGVGMALIRDGNGTRSFETLMRYRSAAMAEFMRALRTLKALQAEAALAPSSGPQADLPHGSHAKSDRTNPRGVRRPGSPTCCPTYRLLVPRCTSPPRPGCRISLKRHRGEWRATAAAERTRSRPASGRAEPQLSHSRCAPSRPVAPPRCRATSPRPCRSAASLRDSITAAEACAGAPPSAW
jgi:hypothetical protein